MPRIGLFGGTFNPVHTGHLVLAQECWHALNLDKVVFIPSYIPPHKDVQGDVSPADRLNMVRLALEGDDRFEISTYEMDKGGVSFSIDTVRHFREVYGDSAGLFFIAGADAASGLGTWKDPDTLLDLVDFVVVSRPGSPEITGYEGRITRVDMPGIDISSSMLRERIRVREPIDHMMPVNVVKYIRNKGLYRD
ncbi:MAG: nicotinate-nucleotide adenylyltransferase [Candidatus Omnitrophica bacterium]|nr:nicotinate-nucleotide adenylyltransferase [Candidatus Omnitrophota bacterium]MDD5488395.1 nicotinate-nucleotide adenylyltransferase [Candidatus Omnitrophota bacterium]